MTARARRRVDIGMMKSAGRVAAGRIVLRAGLRANWRPWILLALLVGTFAGTTMAAVVGARRTESAFDRFTSESGAADLTFDVSDGQALDEVRSLPGVASVGRATSAPPSAFWVQDGAVREFPRDVASIVVDGAVIEGLERVTIRSGRVARSGADEAVANRAWLDAMGFQVGDEVVLRLIDERARRALDDFTERGTVAALNSDSSLGWEHAVRIVGEAAGTADIARDEASRPARLLMADDVAARVWRISTDQLWCCGLELFVDVAEGHVPASVGRALEAMPSDGTVVATLSEQRARVRSATRPYLLALTAFAVLVGAVGVVVVGGAIARQAAQDARGDLAHRASGADNRHFTVFALGRAIAIGAVAVVIALIIVATASPLLVLGPAASVEPDRSAGGDLHVLAVGATLIVLGVGFASLAAVSRVARSRGRTTASPRPLPGAFPIVPGLGFRFAFPRTGPTRFLMRSALLTTSVAVGTATAVAVVSGSLEDLLGHPERYGSSWNVALTCNEGYCPIDNLGLSNFNNLLRERPDVAGWSFVAFGSIGLDGQTTTAIGTTPGHNGPLPFAITSGRAPKESDEVVLGTTTMRRLNVVIGDNLPASVGAPLHVVGSAAFSGLGQADADRASLGIGAGLTAEGLRAHGGTENSANAVLVVGNATDTVKLAAGIRSAVSDVTVITRNTPGALSGWRDLRFMPAVLTGLLALLATGTLIHAVMLSAGSRRRDAAVWSALGLRPRDTRRALLWQGVFLTGTSIVLGVPVGLAAGRSAWTAMRNTLGVSTPTRFLTPLLAAALAVGAAGSIALMIALRPRATGTIAEALRAE